MSIQSNVNRLLGLSAAATKLSAKPDGSLEKDLANVESQVYSLGKYDPESKKFKGTRKDFEKIRALGLDKKYKDLAQKGSLSGLRNPSETAELLLGMENKLTPTKAQQVNKKATEAEINMLAKEKAMSKMQSRGIMKVQQNKDFEILRDLLKSTEYHNLNMAEQRKIWESKIQGGRIDGK
jgi:hypothetical protein